MIPTDLLQRAASAVSSTLNRYSLLIPSCVSPVDVENLTGTEGMSENYLYSVMFTSPDKDIQPEQMLRKTVTLTMRTGLLPESESYKVVHGYITDFRRLTGSADQVSYLIVIEPRFSLLDKQYRSHRFFVNKSVPEVVSQILDEHGFQGWEYEFSLKHDYPKREQINQYQESDLQFIRRLLSETGIFYFFTLQSDTKTEVIRFGDAQSAYDGQRSLPLSNPSGLNDNAQESIWNLNITYNVAEAGVTAKDYNHREAHRVLRSVQADVTRGDGENISYGQVYHYCPRHPQSGDKVYPEPETANFYARLDHERFLARQTLITGICNDAFVSPGQVLLINGSGIATLPAQLQSPALITRISVSGSRCSAFQSMLEAVPYSETLCWRPDLLERPKVSGTMTARVTSAKDNDIYAWQDAAGLYRVVFDADEESRERGLESMPVRLAKPYGGDMYGFHFPLIQGTEVAIAFREGDPDQPYIAHALHDSRHVDHVTEKNSTRNVIRTAGLNKLRMEDKRGEEHIKLSTEYGGKTQLNLGHNVNASRVLRGEGAELRTDKWVTVRGGAGVFITADSQPYANDKMLSMKEAEAQLQHALSIARSLSGAAEGAQAYPADIQSQKLMTDALTELVQPGMVLNAPQGVSISSPEGVRVSSGSASVGIVAQKNADISVMKRFTVAAGEAISMLARQAGMKLFAAKGKVEIQAQDDALDVIAKKDIAVTSTKGKISITAATELVINCDGAYIRLSNGNIELGCPGNILLKCVNVQKMGAASADTPAPEFQKGYGGVYSLTDEAGKIIPQTEYRVTTADGQVFHGVSDDNGKTLPIYTAMPGKLKIEILGTGNSVAGSK